MRAALYARVSTEEQTEGYSIDAQRRAFQTFCRGRGWIPHHKYIEAGRSAHTDDIRKRPVFKQAIDVTRNNERTTLKEMKKPLGGDI